MRARFLLITVVLALFVSSGGGVIAATLCPHKALDHSCCHAMAGHNSASHEAMNGMQAMGDTQSEPVAESKFTVNALSQPVEACAHCINHSQLSTSPATLREANQAKRGVEAPAPLAVTTLASLETSFAPTLSSREHAPPGASPARHVLNSVFRI